jgi:hypothetical protein
MVAKKEVKKEKVPSTMDDFEMLSGEDSAEKILREMLSKENIEMKTEIENPIALAQLSTYGETLALNKMHKSAKTVQKFVDFYLLYMVSKDRKRSEEIIRAIEGRFREPERSLTDKLTNQPQQKV